VYPYFFISRGCSIVLLLFLHFACREGLLLAHHWCHGPLILESDCSNCIVALADNEIKHSIHANLVEDSKNIMRMLRNVRFVKVS
jgi:hypothetical protein